MSGSRQIELRELKLTSLRPADQLHFYRETLGLPAQVEGDQVTIEVGLSRLVFQPAEAGAPPPCYHFAFNIPENKLDAAIAWLRSRAEPLVHKTSGSIVTDFANWNAHAVYFLDADDNIVELIARHDLDNAGSGDFGPADILGLSEIALITPDAPALGELLCTLLDLEVYVGSSGQFCPIGDPQGLLIIIQEGRFLLPTDDVPARIHPTDVVLGGRQERKITLPGLPYRLYLEP